METCLYDILAISLLITCLFNSVSANSCSSITVTSSTTVIQSHSRYGSSDYENNMDECWILTTSDSNKIVEVKRSGFYVESGGGSNCNNDKLTFYNSNTKSGTSIKFCGENIFDQIYSSGRYIYLRFQTNGNTKKKGFQLNVKQVSQSNYDSKDWDASNYDYSGGGGLSAGAIAGIVVGSVVCFFVIMSCCKKKKDGKKNACTAPAPAPAPARPPAAASSSTQQPAAQNIVKPEPKKQPPPPTVLQAPRHLPPITGGPAPPSYNDLFGSNNQTDLYGVPEAPVYHPPKYQ